MGDSPQGQLSYKIIGHLGRLLGKQSVANKTELRELEKDLNLLTQQDADALVEAGTLELLLRYLTVDNHFDVVTKCLNTLSVFDSARTGLYDMQEGGMSWLAEYVLAQTKLAKNEKQIDKAAHLAKILVLYSIDAPEVHITWLTDLAEQLSESLSRMAAGRGMQEAYTYLSVVLPSMWVSMGSTLAPVIAANIIHAGGMPLLLRTAKDVQRSDIKGLPKIIAEKALNLLCACNAEQPALSLQQVDAYQMAAFCIETATKSDWVQSQELSVVLLGRLVFHQRALPVSYLETEPVRHMLLHTMTSKSPALRCTAFCLSCICPESVFDAVCVEASAAITDLAEGTHQSIKRLASPTAGGMTILRWGYPINRFAQDILRSSKLLGRMAEAVPAHLPPQLVELLGADLKQYVTSIKAAQGIKDDGTVMGTDEYGEEIDNGRGSADGQPSTGAQPVYAAQQPAVEAAQPRYAGSLSASQPLKRERQDGQAASSTGSEGGSQSRLQEEQSFKRLKIAGGPAHLPPGAAAAAGPAARQAKPVAAAAQPLAAIKLPSQPQAPLPRNGSGGGEPSVGSIENNAGVAKPGFNGTDASQLNHFLYDLTMESSKMDEKAKKVLQNLLQGASLIPHMLNLKHRLSAGEASVYDNTLRAWSARVRQIGGSLSTSKGPALDMLVQFSGMMFDEITCCSNDLKQSAAAEKGK